MDHRVPSAAVNGRESDGQGARRGGCGGVPRSGLRDVDTDVERVGAKGLGFVVQW